MAQRALPGFRDFYPEQLAERAYIMSVWRQVMRRYAFVEFDGPPLESLEIYRKKSGDELVAQLYAFTDKGDREVALRPEMTPTLARMVAARASSLRKPVRWFSIPQLFRYERQQKGRLREHFQLNADIVGEAGIAADAELVASALDVMRTFGLTSADVVARVSDRQLLQSLLVNAGVAEADLPVLYAVIDKYDRDGGEGSRPQLERVLGNNALANSVATILACRDVASLVKYYGDLPESGEHIERMRQYMLYVADLGFGDWVQLDLTIVRGLAYYTGTVFELFDTAGEMRAICGGGRYDTLLETLGGVDLPALGFGMGDVVLGDLLRSRNLIPATVPQIDFWVASDDDSLIDDVMRIVGELRRLDTSVEFALHPQQLARQLKAAAAAGARRVIILKRDRYALREVTVRDLVAGTERALPVDELMSTLNSQVNG
jgi:histidyl-tRNA synthetase